MSNKHTHSDAAWNIAYEIHSKDAHQWDKAKMIYYRNCEINGAPYPWITDELNLIEVVLQALGLQDQPDPKKWVEDGKDSHRKYLLVRSNNKAKAIIIEQLQAENSQYKTAISEQAVSHSKQIEKLEAENDRLMKQLKESTESYWKR